MKILSTILLLTLLFAALTYSAHAMPFAPFEACKTAGTDLYVKKFKETKKNKVNFIKGDTGCEIEIVSDDSGSMLVRRLGFDANATPYINFDFKVTNIIEGADLKEKDGDDAPARVYVFFEYDPDKAGFLEKAYRSYSGNKSDGKCIVYIWGNAEKKGDVFENPYSDQFMQVIVESGTENVNSYVTIKRNIYKDFKEFFKEEPPNNVSSIAIMTDTDNTHKKATGYFKSIYLSSE